MTNKVIGIVSYLPDDSNIRSMRESLLRKLISRLDSLFNLPIIIVAQNWKGFKVDSYNCTCYHFDKLGITGAREKLRDIFIESEYEYLIMLDDDCEIFGDRESALDYLKQIDDHPNGFYEFRSTLLKFFAISKEIFKEQDYNGINPENEDGFEDRVFVESLRKKFPQSRYIFKHTKLNEVSINTADHYSTWYKHQDLKKMLENTDKYLFNEKMD